MEYKTYDSRSNRGRQEPRPRWLALSIILQIIAMFAVASATGESLTGIPPVLILGFSAIISIEGYAKLRRWD